MTRENARRGRLNRAIQDLRRLAVLCGDAGFPDEEARLLRVSRKLGLFAEPPPEFREIDPFWC